MFVKDFIIEGIPVLKKIDKADYALSLMDDFKLKHLPLLDDSGLYMGIVAEKDLLSVEDSDQTVDQLFCNGYCIKYESNIYEALALVTRYNLSLLPVVDDEKEYKGCITLSKLVNRMADLCNADASGSIIMLELAPADYSLTEIARLVESNHVHIQNVLSEWNTESGQIRVIIKIDAEDASSVVRSFERFNYNVLYYSMERGVILDLLKQRVAEVEWYMNI